MSEEQLKSPGSNTKSVFRMEYKKKEYENEGGGKK